MTAKSEQDAKFELMTTAPVERLVLRMSVPTIISMLISSLYNMADTYFVGSIGTSATAAVGVVFSLMAIIQAIGFFFGHGSGNYVSRQLGAKRYDNASKMAATGFVSSFVSASLIAALGLIFIEPLARLLGATDTILADTCSYLRFILLGAPFMTSSLTLNNQLRFQGSAFFGMLGMATGAIVNIILDPVFIFLFNMGVAGASLATMISQVIGCAILLFNSSRGGNIRINIRNFSPTLSNYKEIFRGGLPSLCRQAIASVATICLNWVAGSYSDAAIAAMSIVSRTTLFANSALLGFGQGFQPVCGFNYGARNFDRVRRAFSFCVKITTVGLFLISLILFIFAPSVITAFRDDPEVIRVGSLALRLQCIFFPLMGWVIINNMMFQTIGKAAKASLLAIARQGLFFIPLLFILTAAFGLTGLQIALPISDVATFIISIPLGLSVLNEMKNAQSPTPLV